MVKTRYLISEAAKEVDVENHVLRYWEEELHLPVKRNPQGHRYYTREDVERFMYVKELKAQGLQLKAIRGLLEERDLCKDDCEVTAKRESSLLLVNNLGVSKKNARKTEEHSDEMQKVHRLQMLLQAMIAEAVSDNNQVLCDTIQEVVQKEMDYQFRQAEEREDARESERREREEDHYKKLDELLRERGGGKLSAKKRFFW